jgi:hypothetical protein
MTAKIAQDPSPPDALRLTYNNVVTKKRPISGRLGFTRFGSFLQLLELLLQGTPNRFSHRLQLSAFACFFG